MDFSQIALNQGLTFLAWVTSVVLIVVAGFLIKLLIDLSKLSKNLNDTSLMLNTELKPTLQELNETLHTINELVKSTDKGVDNVKVIIERVLGKTKVISESIIGGFLKGFVAMLGLFSKK